jgi:hypothetical protein
MTTEHQREQAERRDSHLIGVSVPRCPGLSDADKAKIERKIEEAKQASTLSDHHHNDTGGRWSAQDKQTVTGATPAQAWPPMPEYWAAADMATERPFGQQLRSFDVPLNSVQEKKR